jgi:hypothetical protein
MLGQVGKVSKGISCLDVLNHIRSVEECLGQVGPVSERLGQFRSG